jgi:hypothetical protein
MENLSKMENNEHPTWLVPIDIAKELKEIGFNEACPFIVYPDEDEVVITGVTNVDIDEVDENEGYDVCADLVVNQCYAFNKHNMQTIPTWTEVFAWFRSKGYHSTLHTYSVMLDNVEEFRFYYEINSRYDYIADTEEYYKTYEEAQEALVKALIKTYKTMKK